MRNLGTIFILACSLSPIQGTDFSNINKGDSWEYLSLNTGSRYKGSHISAPFNETHKKTVEILERMGVKDTIYYTYVELDSVTECGLSSVENCGSRVWRDTGNFSLTIRKIIPPIPWFLGNPDTIVPDTSNFTSVIYKSDTLELNHVFYDDHWVHGLEWKTSNSYYLKKIGLLNAFSSYSEYFSIDSAFIKLIKRNGDVFFNEDIRSIENVSIEKPSRRQNMFRKNNQLISRGFISSGHSYDLTGRILLWLKK